MDIKIGNKILEYRKNNNLTQEQLADLLGVSNAAVSKWESGISYPDITLLPSIALLFKVSIDNLFEFDVSNESIFEARNKAEEYSKAGKFSDGISYLREALKRYPNDLFLNLIMARMLSAKGVNSNPVDQEIARESIKYFDKSILLDIEGKNTESIIQNKSFVLAAIGEYKEANELLKELNNDRYTVQIANNLIKMGEFEVGMNLLQGYLNDFTFSFAWLVSNLKKCFDQFGRHNESYDLIKMCATFREFMSISNTPNYYNFLSSKDFLDLAYEARKNNEIEEMWRALEKSVYHAVRFDEDPSFEVNKVNFLSDLPGEFNNGNTLAAKYILKNINENFSYYKDEDKYIKLVDKLNTII